MLMLNAEAIIKESHKGKQNKLATAKLLCRVCFLLLEKAEQQKGSFGAKEIYSSPFSNPALAILNRPLPETKEELTRAARKNAKRQKRKEFLMKRSNSFPMIACAVFCLVSLSSIGLAFFSDFLDQSVAMNSGCIQVTPTMKIDGQTGDRMNAPLQSAATCIPPQYIQTTEVVFDGSQYLDTGVKGSSELKIIADAKFASATTDNNYLFGMRDCSTPGCDERSIIFGSNPGYTFYMNGYHATANSGLSDGRQHIFTYKNGSLAVDGTIFSVLASTPSATWSSNNNVFLGTYNNAGNPSLRVKATLYDFQIYDGSTLVRHMIPVFNSQSSECGLFDVVGGSFYGNLGTGTLSCSKPQINNPNCDNLSCNGQNQGVTGSVQLNTIHQFSYTLANSGAIDYENYTGDTVSGWMANRYVAVDYLQFDGTNYIDAGVDQSGDTLVINADFQFNSLPTTSGGVSFVFGARQSATNNSLAFYAQQGSTNTRLQYGGTSLTSTVVGTATTASRCSLAINIAPSSKDVSVAGCGTPLSGSFTTASTPTTYANNTIFIGGINSVNGFSLTQSFNGKIYSFSITKPTVSRIFIPAYDTATGQCGLFDGVSGAFFGRGSTSTDLTPAKGSCVPPSTSPMKILLYPTTVSDATINTEIAAMDSGAPTSPSAIATLDGSACASTFYGIDAGITPVCMTSMLPSTLGEQTSVGDSRTYDFKFVVWAPAGTSSVYGDTTVGLGVSSGVRGVVASNWKQQVHPYISTKTVNTPIISDAGKNKQPFLDQVADDAATIDDYLLALVTASDVEDGDLTSQIQIVDRGGFDPSAIGSYEIQYKVTDSDGNEGTLRLTVQVWNFTKIVAGGAHAMALGSNGSVWSWGLNNSGELGIGNSTAQSKPVKIPALSNIVDIAASYNASFAVAADGTVYSWGGNTNGIGGTGAGTYPISGYANGTTSNVPRVVMLPDLNSGEKAINVAASFHSAGVVTNEGNVYTWGNGDYGAAGQGFSIGNRETDFLYAPYKNPFMNDVKQIAFGYFGGLAVTNSGAVYSWGTNNEGELGAGSTGTVANCHTAAGSDTIMVSSLWDCQPSFWTNLSGIDSVSAGLRNMHAVSASGQVYAWGRNDTYNLGNGSASAGLIVNSPAAISLADVAQVNSSYNATIACMKSNQVVIWGANSVGAFGNGNSNDTYFYSPTAVSAFPSCKSVAMTQRALGAGFAYVSSLVLSADGTTVYGLGENQYGQLGNNSTATEVYSLTTWAFTPPNLP